MDRLVRAATLSDIEAVREIYAHFVERSAASFELEPPEQSEMERRFHSVVEAGLPYLVAEVDGRVVGYASVSAFRPRPGYRFTVEDSVYVRDGFGGRGLGRVLLQELIARCGAAGFRQMVAVIGGVNPASVALHAGVGFRAVGVLQEVGYKFGEWQDMTLMQLALGVQEEASQGKEEDRRGGRS